MPNFDAAVKAIRSNTLRFIDINEYKGSKYVTINRVCPLDNDDSNCGSWCAFFALLTDDNYPDSVCIWCNHADTKIGRITEEDNDHA